MGGRTDVRGLVGRLRAVSFWVAAGIALLIAHDLVALIQIGPGAKLAEALRTAGHAYWPAASTALILVAVGVVGWWTVRLARLQRRARAVDGPSLPAQPFAWRGRFVRLWPRLFLVVAASFVVQENVEHLFAHEHLPGVGALVGPLYPLALPVIAAITGVAAALVALIRQHEAGLILRIASGRLVLPRPARRRPLRPDRGSILRRDPLARLRSGRAPPQPLLLPIEA
jgi:hypothetical protein